MDSLPSATIIDGRFRVEKLLGAGGYGQVYEAVQLSVGRVVALKVLRTVANTKASNIERFQREAQYACRLTHPNTVIYYDFGQDLSLDIMYLAMEFLAGETLQERLESKGLLSIDATASIMEQICGSLEESHGMGLVHRDIKPANIMLINRAGRDDFVKVIDFGIAKLVQSILKTGGDPQLTGTGMMVGSPHYMAPEQIRGGRTPVDGRTDVYSLACLAYKMMTGRPPFDGPSAFDVATAQLVDPPPPLAQLVSQPLFPAGLQDVLSRALAKDRSERQPTVQVFAAAFRDALTPLRYAWSSRPVSEDNADTPFVAMDALLRGVDSDATNPSVLAEPESDTSPNRNARRHGSEIPDEMMATNLIARRDGSVAPGPSSPMVVEVTPDEHRPRVVTRAPPRPSRPHERADSGYVGSPLRPLPRGLRADEGPREPSGAYSKTLPLQDLGGIPLTDQVEHYDDDLDRDHRSWRIALFVAITIFVAAMVMLAVVVGVLV